MTADSTLKENLIIWRSPYTPQFAKERIFNSEIWPTIEKILNKALKNSKFIFDPEDRNDAKQEARLGAYLWLQKADILKYENIEPPIFLTVRGNIMDYVKNFIKTNEWTGMAFTVAEAQGWRFDSDKPTTSNKQLQYPSLDVPNETMQDLFSSQFSIMIYNAINTIWSKKDSVTMTKDEWQKFFGVHERNYRDSFYNAVLKKAVTEYNSLLAERLTVRHIWGKNQRATGYTLYIRNHVELPRLSLKNSMSIYEYFRDNLEMEITFTPDDFIAKFKIEGSSYKSATVLNIRVIARSVEEINKKSDINIHYEINRGHEVHSTITISSFTFYATKK